MRTDPDALGPVCSRPHFEQTIKAMVDDFERTWTFPEMVRALASQPALPGLTPLSRGTPGQRADTEADPTADVVTQLLASTKKRQRRKPAHDA